MNHFCDGDLLLKSQRSTLSQSSRSVVLLLGYVDRQISRVLKVLIFAKSEWLVTNWPTNKLGFGYFWWLLSWELRLSHPKGSWEDEFPRKLVGYLWICSFPGGYPIPDKRLHFAQVGWIFNPKQGGVDANYQVCRPKSNFLCCLCKKRPFSYAFPIERDHRLRYFETFTSHPGDHVGSTQERA